MKVPFEKVTSFYLAPKSPMTLALKKFLLKSQNHVFLGYIDKVGGDECVNINELNDDDNIFILSNHHALDIYKSLQHKLSTKNISILKLYQGQYYKLSLYELYLRRFCDNIQHFVLLWGLKLFPKTFRRKNKVVLLSPDFVDNNIRSLYFYLRDNTTYDPIIATNNHIQAQILTSCGVNIIRYPSLSFYLHAIKCSISIIDHSPTRFLEILLNQTFSIQLWHGIALKRIGSPTYHRVVYDIFVSTSPYVTQHNFSSTFTYNHVIHSGYPRNDTLLKKNISHTDILFADQEILEYVKNSSQKCIIYVPTYRENSFETNPIDFEILSNFAKEHNLLIIIKLHPFSVLKLFDTLNNDNFTFRPFQKNYLIFYPDDKDIYPILRLTDALITDYSSIAFDYLLVDKPIIYFIYDHDEYLASRGEFMLDFKKHTPGKKCYTFQELLEALCQFSRDPYKPQRDSLKKLLFNPLTNNASSQITKAIDHFVSYD